MRYVIVEGLGKVFYEDGRFDVILDRLHQLGANLIDLRDFAYARILGGRNSGLFYEGHVKQTCIYPSEKQVIFTHNSPIAAKAKLVVKHHAEGREFHVDAKPYLEQAEEDKGEAPEKRRAIIFNLEEILPIPTSDFGKHDLTRFLFRDQAKPYGDRLKSRYNIQEIPVILEKIPVAPENTPVAPEKIPVAPENMPENSDAKKPFEPFARQIKHNGLMKLDGNPEEHPFGLICDDSSWMDIYIKRDIRVYGLHSEEQTSSEHVSLEQVSIALHEEGIGGPTEQRILHSLGKTRNVQAESPKSLYARIIEGLFKSRH